MREDLLHFVWKTNKLATKDLSTTLGKKITVVNSGFHNQHAGPDFFNAKVKIGKQLWAGNVEMHLKASDWYVHGHETDGAYDNVILHVVWDDDVAVFRKDKSQIPTLELKDYLSQKVLHDYKKLLQNPNKTFINCEKDFSTVDSFLMDNWLHRLYFERLEQKSSLIFKLLDESNNDWEKVLFTLLLKNFGLKVNGTSFLSLAASLDFSIIRKLQNNVQTLESVLLGMAGLLTTNEPVDGYLSQLQKEFAFQVKKFELVQNQVQRPEFFGLRPPNFPTIRLSQLANLYASCHNLFSTLIEADSMTKVQSIFKVTASPYWINHFTFGKESKPSTKALSKDFIDLLMINTIIPIKFCYAKKHGKQINDELIGLMTALKSEKNSILSRFGQIGPKTANALESQAKIQLYNEYCSKNQCLKCAVGASLLNRNG